MIESVLVSFFESVKYVGHLFPIALLRVYLGYFYVNQAVARYGSDFLSQPRLAEDASHWLPRSPAPEWFKTLAHDWLVPNWQAAAYAITAGEALIGISFILGYLVRPFSLLGILLSLLLLWTNDPDALHFYQGTIAVHIVLAWLGAGRCLGMDYYFYKKHRGIWW
jgi:thiosulfate dehydrogenase (quinone) large subunit